MFEFLICILSLCFLMLVAYRGFSVILFAPVAALAAVLLTEPSAVLPIYSGLFMDKMVIFVKLYFPVFMLGALFILVTLLIPKGILGTFYSWREKRRAIDANAISAEAEDGVDVTPSPQSAE